MTQTNARHMSIMPTLAIGLSLFFASTVRGIEQTGADDANSIAVAGPAPHSAEWVPHEFRGVGVTERLNEIAPLDIAFKDEHGNDVTLRDYLEPGKPVILTPVYYNCPMLCNLTLNGLVNGLNEIDLSAGKEFTIVSFSINHDEKPPLAEVKKRAYMTQYRRESAKDGWHFLTGSEENIRAMTDGIGFGFKPDGKGDFAHTSTIVFLTPDGVIARYMNDVNFMPRDLRFALIESSKGAIGSAMDKFLLFMCYHYDPLANSYAASAVKIMRLGGLLTLMMMAMGAGVLWWRGSKRSDGLPLTIDNSRPRLNESRRERSGEQLEGSISMEAR